VFRPDLNILRIYLVNDKRRFADQSFNLKRNKEKNKAERLIRKANFTFTAILLRNQNRKANQSKVCKTRRRLIFVQKRLIQNSQGNNKMIYCPECGGEMQYVMATKHYVCKSCGLSVTQQELMELREKNRPVQQTEEEEKENRRKEYLKWWLSKK
jgi:NADH pyrophosphatase NudC (nudix superfamily)